MKVGDRVRLRSAVTTKGGQHHPVGSSGVVTAIRGYQPVVSVDMDSGTSLHVLQSKLELWDNILASHYQPARDVPGPIPVLDDDADDIPTSVTADAEEIDYLAITRSFCR